jgi:glucose/arabinose dehydrogenase
MVYGADAVLPAEVCHNTPRVAAYNKESSNKALEDAIDLVDEARDIALARSTVYRQGLRNYHTLRLRSRTFNARDLVSRLKKDTTSCHLHGRDPMASERYSVMVPIS